MHIVSQTNPNNAINAMCKVLRLQCASCGLIIEGTGKGIKFPLSFEPGMSHGICIPCKRKALADFRRSRHVTD